MISFSTVRRTFLYRSWASLLQRGEGRCPASLNEHREAGRAACPASQARQGREAIKQPQSAQRTGRLRIGQWMSRLTRWTDILETPAVLATVRNDNPCPSRVWTSCTFVFESNVYYLVARREYRHCTIRFRAFWDTYKKNRKKHFPALGMFGECWPCERFTGGVYKEKTASPPLSTDTTRSGDRSVEAIIS